MSSRMMKYFLGGTSVPTAGDGMGLGVPSRPMLSPKAAIPSNIETGVSTDYFPRTRSRSNVSAKSTASATSQNPVPVSSPHPQDRYTTTTMPDPQLFGSSQHVSRKNNAHKLSRVQNGVRAPRCSLANLAPATIPSRKPSIDSFQTAASTAVDSPRIGTPDAMGEVSWEDYEIPQELEFVRGDTPREIRNIVQESLDEHRAMRTSRLQSQASVVRTDVELSTILRQKDRHEVPENSPVISARSTPDSDYDTNRSASSLCISHGSGTSLESEAEDTGFLRPPKMLSRSQANSSRESLRTKAGVNFSPSMAAREKRLLESQERTIKSHKLFKLLSGRKRKSESPLGPQAPQPTSYECTSCFDDVPGNKAVDVPCRHKYCSPCFSQLILTAIANEVTFPPKCCLQEIPKKIMRDHLPPGALAQFDERALEYAVAVGNRYYCVSPKCAKWIDTRSARRMNGILECPHCAVKLCTTCRGPQHPSNEDCPQDYGLGPTLDQAERAGWRRCYRCRAIVELTSGCRHITCKCRAEFW